MILNCRDLVEKASDARDGKLSLSDRIGYAIHLAWCHHCRVYVQQIEQVIQALRDTGRSWSAPDDVRDAVLRRFAK